MHWKYWIKNHSHGKARYMGTPRLWERKIGSYYSKGRMMTGALCRSPLLALCTRRSGVAVRTYAPSKHIKILNSPHLWYKKVFEPCNVWFFRLFKFVNKTWTNMFCNFPPLIFFQSFHNLLCGLPKCTLHTLLHLPQGNSREFWCTHKITFQRREVCREASVQLKTP